ncbi:MAG: response regulator transcription factor [Rhodospirillaceae bacterium]
MSQSLHILIVDDEPALIRVLEPVLTSAGHVVTTTGDAESALGAAQNPDIDIILLDLGLPDLDGKQVIATIRKSSNAPILVISARHEETEKIAALDAGADDYVNKPFEIGELLARIRAAARRLKPAVVASRFKSREIEIDFGTRNVLLFGEQVHLSPKEFELLKLLATHSGQVVTHKRLLAAGWAGVMPDTQYLRSYMALLRQKIERDPSEPEIILTEPGVGYRLRVND